MFSTLCTKLWILKDNLKDDARGVSALEYVILVAVIVGVLFFFSDEIAGIYSKVFGDASGKVGELLEKDYTPDP